MSSDARHCLGADPHESGPSKGAMGGFEMTPAMVRRQVNEAVDALRLELKRGAAAAAEEDEDHQGRVLTAAPAAAAVEDKAV